MAKEDFLFWFNEEDSSAPNLQYLIWSFGALESLEIKVPSMWWESFPKSPVKMQFVTSTGTEPFVPLVKKGEQDWLLIVDLSSTCSVQRTLTEKN